MKEKILKTLSKENNYVSGEKLSELCGVSRTAIWKHIKSLKEEGYEIESQPRKGYLLKKKPDLLLKPEILTNLNTKKWGKEYLYTFDEVDSTNIIAKKLANEGKPEGTVVVAEHQIKGKGRLGRTWVSPKGKGIWVSLILRPEIIPAKASQITFVIAVGMIKALKKALGIEAKIKWPNDILIDNKKICGILTELSAEIEQINFIIVGIGVNVNQNSDEFNPEFKEKATSLKLSLGKKISRVLILKTMLEEIEKTYNSYLKKGFKIILEDWKKNTITLGNYVEVISGKEKLKGIAFDVDEEGCLYVKDESNNLHKIIAGDVSVRNPNGKYV